MTKILLTLAFGLVMEAAGVVYLSRGLKEVGGAETISVAAIARLIGRGVTNGHILLGVFLEAIFFGCLLYLLAKKDVSFVWPLTALSFVMTTLAAKFVLKEPVDSVRWFGVSLIMVGAAFITYSEKTRENRRESSAVHESVEK